MNWGTGQLQQWRRHGAPDLGGELHPLEHAERHHA
jgi:hypothetical protein